MKYNFNQIIERRNTACAKWDGLEEKFGNAKALSLWVADMDFPSPKPVIEAIEKRAQHGVFGYLSQPDSIFDAAVGWHQRHHDWEIDPKWLLNAPGVVTGIRLTLDAFTKPGDKVLLQTPVYYPFYDVIAKSGCQVTRNPLLLKNGRYEIDFEDLMEKTRDDEVKVMILCHPHNPVSRCWSRDELQKIGDICLENNVLIISDEIHCDLVFAPFRHIPLLTVSERFKENAVVWLAPSKTFNLAGLRTSMAVIENPDLHRRFNDHLQNQCVGDMTLFGAVALEAAYKQGDDFYSQLMPYLKENQDYIADYIDQKLSPLKLVKPEATYLAWIDCRRLNLDRDQMIDWLINKTGIAVDYGHWFGDEGDGFFRLNYACPRSILVDCMNRLEKSLKNL